jgi:hypothetical protein
MAKAAAAEPTRPVPTRWEIVGAWLHVWTPPRDVDIPPVPRRKLAIWGTVAAVVLAGALALIIPAIQTGKEKGAAERAREHAALVIAQAKFLRQDQRLHLATAAPGADLVTALQQQITADARARVRAHKLGGPIVATQCSAAGRYVIQFAHSRVYKCFVATATNLQGEGNDKFDTGYPFVATIYTRTRKLAWCKENPQPGEKTRGHGLARVVMSPVCAGKLSALL